jgi:hypothetical protein
MAIVAVPAMASAAMVCINNLDTGFKFSGADCALLRISGRGNGVTRSDTRLVLERE